MPEWEGKPPMSDQETHTRLSIQCFDDVWGLLDKPDRSVEDDRLMREMAHASLFHWLRRDDCSPQNLSIGLWQVSRVHAALGDGPQAMCYAEECIELSDASGLPSFYRGYAYEAGARAARCVGDLKKHGSYLQRALDLAGKVEDANDRSALNADLEELAAPE